MRRRRGGGMWVVLILAGVLLALLAWQFMGYRRSLRGLPAGMTVAGLDVEGRTIDQVVDELGSAFAQPVQLTYRDQALALTPESVAFQFDPEGTRAALELAVQGRAGVKGFLAYLLRRPPERVEVLPAATYSVDRLEGFLNMVAQQSDHPPQEPVPIPESRTFRAGRPGYALDHEASRQRVADALLSAVDREADLVVHIGEAPPLEMAHLEEMLEALVADFAGVPSIFVKDLQTGEELEINPAVAYAGTGVLKIAVLVEAYRALDEPPTVEQMHWITQTMTGNDNLYANRLLQDVIGHGDVYQGAQNLTTSMVYLGLLNTFVAAPYDVEEVPFTVVTPANSRTDINTQAGPDMQTTASDIGLLLEMIYHCSTGGGALMVAYPGAFTPQECQQMLEVMAQNQTDSLIEVGLPPETPLAHKDGWVGHTHADAAIVFGPAGDFLLVVFLHQPNWLAWELSNPLVADIAAATYNFFNPLE